MAAILRPGVLLLADPGLTDPNFEETVILLGHHGPESSLGLVLNRPLEILLGQLMEVPSALEDAQQDLSWGGPVGLEELHVLHDGGSTLPHSQVVAGDLAFGGGLEDLARLHGRGGRLRFFLGYSGWGEGQLANELEEGTWRILEDPELARKTALSPPSPTLWADLLARLDPRLGWLRNRPEDPETN